MSKQTLQGHLDLLILAVMSDGAKHGYAVIAALRERSGSVFDLPEGTVYPALHRLEKNGHLSSEWSAVQGRRRRTYQLTESGQRALGQQLRSWEKFSAAVAEVLNRGPAWPATR